MESGLHPLDCGFDYFYGTAGSNDPITVTGQKQVYETFRTARREEDWPVSLFRNHECIEKPTKQSLFTQRYTREAVRIIKEQKSKGQPFFIYLAHNMPHVPLFASERFLGKSKGGLYGDVVEEIDWSVGEIVSGLEREGLSENTFMLFTSDTGPWTMFEEFGGSAGPLRGEKGTGWEGGPRVPAVFCWPGRIEPGITPAFMVNLDMYATAARITESELPSGYALDSLDMSGALLRGDASPRTNYLFFFSLCYKGPFSYRSGRYKIHFRTNDRSRDPITGEIEPVVEHDPPLLFDLEKEISEATSIAKDSPKELELLTKEYRAAEKEITGENLDALSP